MDKTDKIKETELGYSSDSPDKTLENALPAITKSYRVQNLPEVKEFLLTRPNLIKILEEFPQKASQFFPANRGVSLKLQLDPEEGYEELIEPLAKFEDLKNRHSERSEESQ